VPPQPNADKTHGLPASRLSALGLAALGIVFGDIGTSPLYTLKAVLDLTAAKPNAAVILGVLSLILWTLLIITTIKYVAVAISTHNNGEGGILALMSLIGIKKQNRPIIIAIGLFGAALIYGDGAITPAISVLSALEGLQMVTPAFTPYVLPAAVVVLLGLFLLQPLGTALIGKAFGPIMALWFLALTVMGIAGIVRHPGILAAINPVYGLEFLTSSGFTGFLILGAVFLCVTGAEALYADMGHFGPKPIRLAWLGIVFPSLLLNYAGQAAIVLDGASADGNIFYQLCPAPLLVPMVLLATVATVIASQAIITGAFSMTRQAINLGWLPRLAIKQTSAQGYGQIYVGAVNWILMVVTIALTVGFQKSDNLASAYGIAVSLTMLMTTVLLFIAMREIWHWNVWAAGAVAGFLFIVDCAFFTANLAKVIDGGYVPLVLAAVIYSCMWIWHRGQEASQLQFGESVATLAEFNAEIAAEHVARVPGTAVFLTRSDADIPPVLLWHLRQNRSLHENLIMLKVRTAPVPWIDDTKRLRIKPLAPNFWRIDATFGFMTHLDVPAVLADAKQRGCRVDLSDVTYYVGHSTVTHRRDGKGIPRWQQALYSMMERNSLDVADVLQLPEDHTVELGRHVAI
jgi:KUP system potassium uptake protein